MVRANNGTIISARTAEFGFDTESDVLIIPRERTYTSQFHAELKGRSWKMRYAVIGANILQYPLVIDGFNEAGLAVSALYYDGASYAVITEGNAGKAIAPWELPTWILAQFGNVEEVRKELDDVVLANIPLEEADRLLPLHFAVYDSRGKGLILGVEHGKIVVHDSVVGVLTGAPEYRWHLTNLRNYLSVQPVTTKTLMLGYDVRGPGGLEAGLRGTPGDYSSVSRFIRAVALLETSVLPAGNQEAVVQSMGVLNHLAVPSGMVVENTKKGVCRDYKTYWTSAMDLIGKRYYFHTSHNRTLRMVDLNRVQFSGQALKTVPMRRIEPIATDITRQVVDFVDGK